MTNKIKPATEKVKRKKAEQFASTHNLHFEVAEWLTPEFTRFRIGTCNGLWRSTLNSYDILAVTNNEIGNGHFTDVLEWFENSCKRDGKMFKILEVWNEKLKQHLIYKQGFKESGLNDVLKEFK